MQQFANGHRVRVPAPLLEGAHEAEKRLIPCLLGMGRCRPGAVPTDPISDQAETGFFAGAETFISFIRLPPMIFSTSSWSKSLRSSTKVMGSYRPSGCGQSDPNITRSVPTILTISLNRSSQNGVMYTQRLNASIGSSLNAFGIFL